MARTAAADSASPLTFHRLRKRIHVACFLAFLALPFFNVVRFDIPRERFYFFGYELWIQEFGSIFFALMFLMFLIAAASMFYGRVYCSYLCPQMIFSEASIAIEERLRKIVNKRFPSFAPPRRRLLARALFYMVLAAASVFLAFVFIAYFIEPRDLFARLLSFDIVTAGGIAGAATTVVTFLDFALVRQRFCTTVCPYGYLQGMLADKSTLLVQYRDGAGAGRACIECKKCVRVCHMDIDIRDGPFQIECVHCGECIDACDEVLARLNKPGLIHYAWGERGALLGEGGKPWYYRLGLRDAKRVVVMFVLLFYASGLFVALSMRRAVRVEISPDRAQLFWRAENGDIVNRFRVKLANRGSRDANVVLSLDGLDGARLKLDPNPLPLDRGESLTREFEVAVAPGGLPPGVNHFRFVARSQPENATDQFKMTFIMEGSKP
ncbi:MAG: 4Fe-4S binding protein [Bryobacteraceae bacterium]|nr:4Fe-4S binding protein [Bryobacteraceae bacterium]